MSDAFRLWAESYEVEPNALLQLGDRALESRLGELAGLRALDAGCGTGRWMRSAMRAGARVAGFDRERAMLDAAPPGARAVGELGRAPFRAGAFDLAVAAFSLSHVQDPAAALADLCDLIAAGGRIAIVDLHPDGVEAGWRRTFRAGGRTMEVPSRVENLEAALASPAPGFRTELLDSFRFGAPERELFEAEHWARVCGVWAVRLAFWRRLG